MYVTRPLSMYKKDPSALTQPPQGPNSGYLVLMDEGARNRPIVGYEYKIKQLPFPQNKNLSVDYVTDDDAGDKVLFIPVLNQPLSSNRYYVIGRWWVYPGLAITSSKEEDVSTCLCCTIINDVQPKPLDPFNEYQQFEIIQEDNSFYAESVATNGIPPYFLRRKGWTIGANTPQNYHFDEALGSNDSLRALLPDFNFPLSNDLSESVIVGKWYCPFMFVNEGMRLKDQIKKSMFYKITLEQRWEKIFSKENNDIGEDFVVVDVVIPTEVAKVAGRDVVWDENGVIDKVIWFKSFDDNVGAMTRVGLRWEIIERMKWEQERFGWIGGNERHVRIERVEEFGGNNTWRNFSCYVLVESFVLKRMNGSLVLSYYYKHIKQIRCKWD